MELTLIQKTALWGFIVAAIFGAVAYKTNFCTMGAVSDWVNMGDKRRLRAWILAMGIAVVGTQGLMVFGPLELKEVISLNPAFSWLACLVGGVVFGIGMTLGSGCGQRTLVRLGAGNMKSLLVVVLIGITAYATFRGILYFIPRQWLWPVQIQLPAHGIPDQSLVAVAGGLADLGMGQWVRGVIASAAGFILIGYAFMSGDFRRSGDNILAGVVVGLAIVAGWYITGIAGRDEFEPVPVESMSFILPTGNMVNYLMTYTGAAINFGIATVLGLVAGSFLYSVATRQFRLEGFSSRGDTMRHIFGGVLMGIGGIVGFGCTIGQGVSGISTLSMGALLTTFGIIFGSALTMKVEYYRMDDLSFVGALARSLRDMLPVKARS